MRRSYPTTRNMGVRSEMEEHVPLRLFEVYIRYRSPRPNLLIMESMNLSKICFISRERQTAAQAKHWKIPGLSSGVSPRYFYCGKTTVISV